MKEFTIPVGHQVCVSPTVNQRLKESWKDPEIFNPDRWVAYLTYNVTLTRKPYCMYTDLMVIYRYPTCNKLVLQQTLFTSIYRYLASEDKTEKFAYVPFGAGKVLETARVTFITSNISTLYQPYSCLYKCGLKKQ